MANAPKRKAGAKAKAEAKPQLTDKQLSFVTFYLRCWNATEAAKLAGYSEKTAQEQSSRLLSNVIIRALIDEKIKENMMSAEEVLIRMSDIGRSDIGQLMDVSGMGFNLDMAKAKELGLTKLIKRVKQKTTTYLAKSESDEDREETVLEIELYDAQSALVTMGKQHGLFSTKIEIKDWREEARKAGYDPDKLFADLVEAARKRRAEVDGNGNGGGDSSSLPPTPDGGRADGE